MLDPDTNPLLSQVESTSVNLKSMLVQKHSYMSVPDLFERTRVACEFRLASAERGTTSLEGDFFF